MLTVLAVLGWALLALLAAIVLVLFSQMHLRIILRTHEKAQFVFELRLFSSRLPYIVRVKKNLEAKESGAATFEPARRKEKKKRFPTIRKSSSLSRRVAGQLRDVPAVISDTLSGIHLDKLSLHACIGLTDPADTGQLYGMLCPLNYATSSDRFDVEVTPDFTRAGFEGDAELTFHFVPARLAWPTMRFASRVMMVRS